MAHERKAIPIPPIPQYFLSLRIGRKDVVVRAYPAFTRFGSGIVDERLLLSRTPMPHRYRTLNASVQCPQYRELVRSRGEPVRERPVGGALHTKSG